MITNMRVVIKADEWPGLVYLRERTPPDSVVLINDPGVRCNSLSVA